MGFADCLDGCDDEGGEAGFGLEGPQEWNGSGSEYRRVARTFGIEGANAATPSAVRKRARDSFIVNDDRSYYL